MPRPIKNSAAGPRPHSHSSGQTPRTAINSPYPLPICPSAPGILGSLPLHLGRQVHLAHNPHNLPSPLAKLFVHKARHTTVGEVETETASASGWSLHKHQKSLAGTARSGAVHHREKPAVRRAVHRTLSAAHGGQDLSRYVDAGRYRAQDQRADHGQLAIINGCERSVIPEVCFGICGSCH